MCDDLTERLGTGESDVVVPLWPSGPVEPVPAEAPEAVASQLCEVARKQAKGWILSGRKSRSRVPMEKQKRATSLLLAQARLRKRNAERGNLSELQKHLPLRSLRLLLSASFDVRASVRSDIPYPQVRIDDNQEVPRPYLAAKGFLDAVHFAFSEASFIEYMEAAQEAAPFEMAEIWALQPMMKLVLLEVVVDELLAAAQPGRLQNSTSQNNAGVTAAIGITQVVGLLRELDRVDFKDSFPRLSKTDEILREDPARAYPCMEFESCELYRSAIQEFARRSKADEFTIARLAVDLAAQGLAEWNSNPRARDRRGHVGYYLIDRGRRVLQKHIAYHPRGSRQLAEIFYDAPELLYFISLEVFIFAVMAFVVSGLEVGVPLLAATLLLLLPASEAAMDILNQLVTFLVPARILPKLDFSSGIPPDCLTIVAIPTLLINEEQIRALVRTLEIRFAGNQDPQLYFALLTDPPDSAEKSDDKDQYVTFCSNLIQGLNEKYAKSGRTPFFHFHRQRVFNESESTWMGWERKRGKLLDFNELLRGEADRFPVKIGDLSILPRTRYVITLDSDTQLPRDSAHRLVGALAHPLNRAEVNPVTNTVQEGYGVLQPRVGISVHSANRSRLAYIYSGQTGLDIYTRAVSDVYQDLFGEGIFTGKGIYEVDVFRDVLGERFPSNAILSHDLIEGAYARAGLVSDVEIIDDYPSHFSAHSRRKHRWIRGDWQILRWLFSRVPDAHGNRIKNPLSVVSRWKILDNLRRSVIESAMFVLLFASWFFLPGSADYWTSATVALMLIPRYMQLILSLVRIAQPGDRFAQLKQTADDFIAGQVNVLIFFAFLAHQTLVTMDAVFRTVVRLTVTHRNLLEWETAAQSEMESKRKTPVDVYLDWTPLVTIAVAVGLAVYRPQALPAALPILTLWMFSRPLAQWLDRPMRGGRSEITEADESFLRIAALKTWRFFQTFSNAENNWLIPDNVQGAQHENAHRISPTNLGLLLNSQYAAYNLGFVTLKRYLDETERTFSHAKDLSKFNGHFFNWYDTRSLTALQPLFVSSVDSGNLACSLLLFKQGCLAAVDQPILPQLLLQGMRDHMKLAEEELKSLSEHSAQDLPMAIRTIHSEMSALGDHFPAWIESLPKLEASIRRVLDIRSFQSDPQTHDAFWWLNETIARLHDLRDLVEALAPWLLPEFAPLSAQLGGPLNADTVAKLTVGQLPKFLSQLEPKLKLPDVLDPGESPQTKLVSTLFARLHDCCVQAETMQNKFKSLAGEAEHLVQQMDFRIFYNVRRKILSVGYDVGQKRLLESCYDLLASEARSAVFVAVAKGDIPQKSWFLLGRAHTRYARKRVLLSWTGTMFEYLMPSLWMKTYPATLLENSTRNAVACQRKHIQRLDIPWGISEGASSLKNDSGHYVYYPHGVAPLALKTEIDERTVITPYSTFLALSVDPCAAVENLRTMKNQGWLGTFGFYESVDFTRRLSTEVGSPEIVHCWMAHHQGMILLAVCNLLSESVFQCLFHDEVIIAATERLLHERVPFATAVHYRTEEDHEVAA